MSSKKSGIGKFLNDLVDDDGLKTGVTVHVSDQTFKKLTTHLVATVILGSVAFFVIRGIANHIQSKAQLKISKG